MTDSTTDTPKMPKGAKIDTEEQPKQVGSPLKSVLALEFPSNLSLINKSDKLKTLNGNLCRVISALSCAVMCHLLSDNASIIDIKYLY